MISKEPLCTANQLDCVSKTKVDTSSCWKPCSGFFVTSFTKIGQKKVESYYQISEAYGNYKLVTHSDTMGKT